MSERVDAANTTIYGGSNNMTPERFSQLTAAQGNQTLVNARSASRVGTGDVGTNAIRLRAFFALL